MTYKILIFLLLLSVFKIKCFASDWDFLSIHGYGSIGGAYQDDDIVLNSNPFNTVKSSQGDFAFRNYSNLGLQVDASLSENITFTLQALISENYSKHELLTLSWLNFNYQVNDEWAIKVGKMRRSGFMYADILDVSYAYDWVKLPEMYSIMPFHDYTGVEIHHNIEFDNVLIRSTFMYGQSKNIVLAREGYNLDLNAEEMKGVTVTLSWNNLLLHTTYNQNNLKVKNLTLNRSSTVQSTQRNMPKEVSYWDIGGRYNFDNSYLLSEYIKINSNSFLVNYKSYYVGSGYNFENWSPFILYSKTHSQMRYKNISINSGIPLSSIGSNSKIGVIKSEIKSLGLRYNLSKCAVIKFQYDHHKELQDRDSISNQDNAIDVDVFSTAISIVF